MNAKRSDIEDLLPWHAAGTLTRRETQRVEAALANDPELARRYELVREELAQTIHLNETLGAPSVARHADAVRQDRRRAGAKPEGVDQSRARIGELFANLSPRTLAWSGIAAALVLMLQAGVITGIMLKEKSARGGYETASAPTRAIGEGAYVLIRFQPQASAADIDRFLETHKLSIADGPSAGGLYRVRVAPTKLPKLDQARIVKTLQDNKVVGFIAMTE